MILSSVVAAAVAYPYPMAMPVAIAYPDQVPTYMQSPKFDEPMSRSDVIERSGGHHGYDEHLGRVKMQVGLVWSTQSV